VGAAVLSAHVALLLALLVTHRVRNLPSTASVEIISLSPSKERLTLPRLNLAQRPAAALSSPGLPEVSLAPAHTGGAGIDWAGELAHVARSMPARERAELAPADSKPNSVFLKPEHHAGEEFMVDGGHRAVWINRSCYQVFDVIVLPGSKLGASLPSTVCPGLRHEARGDLFKDLPAYQKLHPVP
jgi:hypothetical protein